MSAPAEISSLGIRGLLGVHYYVRDLERSRRFYVDRMGFSEIGRSEDELERLGRQTSRVFAAGDIVITCSSPIGEGGRAHRYLAKHPDGIGTLAFEVEDIHRTFRTLEARGGTPITEVQSFETRDGAIETFSITTPFGDTTFRFLVRNDTPALFPGMVSLARTPVENELGLSRIDHVTSNFQTMKPALLWLEHVMGMTPLWGVEFHTRAPILSNRRTSFFGPSGAQLPPRPNESVGAPPSGFGAPTPKHPSDAGKREVRDGSGLRSLVMWDPVSGIKFANNEPYRPSFKNSQINVFYEDNRGDGVQHVALATDDILRTVKKLKGRGVELMPTPHAYYEALPARLESLGIDHLDEDVRELEELGILVDGSGPNAYLLQIFLKDSAGLYGSPDAGPFFFEIIQRKGDQGFGAGNFRALFESIEREQAAHGET